eukprot:CAMPEP_0116543314 /NCGR_PEP_ID=MMETSP0397-20121206/1489_1 /TAXON_ID=216820 /ORGANISM="Cyclophora tenuis, Strain ECT3854" /LENGTH=638 /DNA_ID=CAMNT_0004067393 /DNA_START=32 /DNA_END=1945 /DNA_ORIENTATION=+
MISNFPTSHIPFRSEAESSHTFHPPFAYGGFYGLSLDLVHFLMDSTTQQTVWRKDISYEVSHHARAIGLSFLRSQALPKTILFVPGIYHHCSHVSIDCDEYTDYVAFAVPSGGSENLESQGRTLEVTADKLDRCRRKGNESRIPLLFRIPQQFSPSMKQDSAAELVTNGCARLSFEGKRIVSNLESAINAARAEMDSKQLCAEELYLFENEDVKVSIAMGKFKSGWHHFVEEGWKNIDSNYFCPDYCQEMTLKQCLSECERTSGTYVETNLQVGTEAGIIDRRVQHFKQHGSKKGKSFDCLAEFNNPGIGTGRGCGIVVDKFIANTESVVSTWSLFGDWSQLAPPGRCKALMLVDNSGGKRMEYALRVHRRFLGPDWLFYVIGPHHLVQQWKRSLEGPMVKVISVPEKFGGLSDNPQQNTQLYRSFWLWNHTINCEYVLHSLTDVLQLRPGAEDFLNYAFVGSPVPPETLARDEWSRICVKHHTCGGRGGFSLRRRSFILKALTHCKIKFEDTSHEDMWYAECMNDMGDGDYMPYPALSNRLSLGSKCEVDSPVGMHYGRTNCATSTCVNAIVTSKLYKDLYGSDHIPSGPCAEGEHFYYMSNPKMQTLFRSNMNSTQLESSETAWNHYSTIGKSENQ